LIYLKTGYMVRTLVCCKIQGRFFLNSGERPIKIGYSWFFMKVVLATR